NSGYAILEQGGNAIDAVIKATTLLEDSPLFNAGKGSVFTAEGTHEMDAAIMEGKKLRAGAVSLLKGIRNPILVARKVMENSEHVLLAGDGALKFAEKFGFTIEVDSYFYDRHRFQQWQEIKDTEEFQLDHSPKKNSKFGTVGAVACDTTGNLAAATSTGGMTNKRYGRIGDSPIIGAGTYANNNTCAVSCTGNGEYFMRNVTAYDMSALMEFKGLSLEEAGVEVIHNRLLKLGGEGGLIAVDRSGTITMPFNSEGMYRAFKNSSGEKDLAIYKD
ncbi:MAG: isoaspartyl peptidase/L-asparaginase, partial [Flavobacteriaceae bacterium]|nr:isoaspartyl peptidase/L-asparaginase [Flavobacteriaceae bacterium]